MCQREVPAALITLHHLTPKERGGRAKHRTPLCRPCHKQVHPVYSNKELARLYADIPSLRASPRMQPFLKWIRKQAPERTFRTVMSDAHPKARRRR